MFISKGPKKSFFELLMKEKKEIPASNKYKSWIKPKIKGSVKLTSSKASILECISFEKSKIPAPNKYEPYKSLA